MDIITFQQSMIALPSPWRACRAAVDPRGQGAAMWLEHGLGERVPCPECGTAFPVYDHTPERDWRHLDTCEYQTWLHARFPRASCPQDGARMIKRDAFGFCNKARMRTATLFHCRGLDVYPELS